jgi:alpha-L-rhamnosidase
VLSPGFTVYEKRIETLTYDVSSLLKKGNNTLGLELAEGWHSGRLIFRKDAKHSPQVIAQLEVKYKNGEVETFITDNSWKGTAEGPIRYSSLYDGEWYDANREIPGWNAPGFNDSEWLEVAEQAISPEVKLVPKRHYTTKTIMSLATQSISEPSKGNVVFDLGQNMVGVPKIKVPVKKGQKLQIRFAEMLDKDGEIYTKNYRSAVSKDFYIPSEDGMVEWQPKFTFHGFRYIELSGFDENATPEKAWVSGLVQHSDFDISGKFQSSHEKLNQLQSNIEWGLRGNFLDIPTDCPQRDERVGWTGDAQVFIPTSLFIADVHSFWASWMQSVRDEQRKDGSIPIIVPNVDVRGRSSSGWGDVATIIPWETYFRTGDIRILEDSYQTMMGWINYYRSQSQNHIVDMFTYGDWLQPFSEHPTDERKGETDEQLINTAYYARSVDLTLQTATELGLIEDMAMLESWLSEVRTAFQNHFFNADGSVSKGIPTQTAYLLAMDFNLLTPEMKEKAIPHLIRQIEKADFHLRTGFLGTPLLAPVLENIGRIELMFEMLFKETYPSWFYSINQGATTMWERWNSYTHEEGFHPAGMNSFNHYAYGAVGQFMYERIAGISPMEPGYKKIRIAPRPGGPITSAEGEYDSPYGKIKSQWELKSNEFMLHVTIPPNTMAHVEIPVMDNNRVEVDNTSISNRDDIEILNEDDNYVILKIVPGSYQITSK